MRTSTSYPNGVTMRQEYDNARRLSCIYAHTGAKPPVGGDGCPNPSTSLVTFRSYDYTGPGGIDTTTRYGETNRNDETTAYTYDSMQRLESTTTKNPGGTTLRAHNYTVGDKGNINKEVVTGTQVPEPDIGTTSFAYTDNNELCWKAAGTPAGDCTSPPAGATTYDYDNAGNLTGNSAGLDAGYNLQGQTVEITPPGGQLFAMEYADATSDRRTQAGDRRMSYNLLGLAAQGPNSGVPHTNLFIRDPGGTLISRADREVSHDSRDLYYLFDGLGSVIATTDKNGVPVRRYEYEPYGEQINPDENDPQPWRYAGGYFDKTTGMVKFGTRYYMPDLMRWTQPDPVAGTPSNPMTLNAYAYVGCDPINTVDPSGRWGEGILDAVANWSGWDELGRAGGIIGGCAAGAAIASTSTASIAPYIVAFVPYVGAATVAAIPLAGCIGGIALSYTEYGALLEAPIGS